MSADAGTAGLVAGRRALVTGGASGIGAATAAALASAGAHGCVVDLAAGGAPAGWPALAADVRDEAAIEAAVAQAASALGGLDIVVAAAGIVPAWSAIEQLDLHEWDEVLAVNARGVAATLKHAAPHLRAGGAIVAVASLNAWRGDPNLAAYVASKHAVLGIVRAAALDLGRRGIRVNAVAPGPVATDALLARMARRESSGGLDVATALAGAAAQTALGRIATAQDVASAILFLASDLAAAITGHLLPVDGGL
jgi:NAD(P)-dependent dehydrogenase (short-subunit alcohol dehydrogenase family)